MRTFPDKENGTWAIRKNYVRMAFYAGSYSNRNHTTNEYLNMLRDIFNDQSSDEGGSKEHCLILKADGYHLMSLREYLLMVTRPL